MSKINFMMKYGTDGVHYHLEDILHSNLSTHDEVDMESYLKNNIDGIKKVFHHKKHVHLICGLINRSEHTLPYDVTDELKDHPNSFIRHYLVLSNHNLSPEHLTKLTQDKHIGVKYDLIQHRWHQLSDADRNRLRNDDSVSDAVSEVYDR